MNGTTFEDGQERPKANTRGGPEHAKHMQRGPKSNASSAPAFSSFARLPLAQGITGVCNTGSVPFREREKRTTEH